MKKFKELQGTMHNYRGYIIRQHDGKYHVHAGESTGSISNHPTKKDAKSRIDHYNRLPQKGVLRRDFSDLVDESVWESYRDKALLAEAKVHHVLKGHPYHHKSDAELHYIIKDAKEAEDAVSGHDQKAMHKYADQRCDASTVLGYRQRGGKQVPHKIQESHAYQVGDKVVTKLGPHKGQVHRVIHVHDSGDLNITPEVAPRRNRYHLGAAKASPDQVTRHIEAKEALLGRISKLNRAPLKEAFQWKNKGFESKIKELERIAQLAMKVGVPKKGTNNETVHGSKKLEESKFEQTHCSQCGIDLGPGEHGCSHCEHHRRMPGQHAKKSQRIIAAFQASHKGINRKSVQEAFEAAKDKKNGKKPDVKKDAKVTANDFDKPKELNTPPGDTGADQAEVQAKPPQFGGKDGGPEKKKDNAPTPEKKGNKLVVKGPGPDDVFQPDPIVTPVTTMPDTASVKSGSQGIR